MKNMLQKPAIVNQSNNFCEKWKGFYIYYITSNSKKQTTNEGNNFF